MQRTLGFLKYPKIHLVLVNWEGIDPGINFLKPKEADHSNTFLCITIRQYIWNRLWCLLKMWSSDLCHRSL